MTVRTSPVAVLHDEVHVACRKSALRMGKDTAERRDCPLKKKKCSFMGWVYPKENED